MKWTRGGSGISFIALVLAVGGMTRSAHAVGTAAFQQSYARDRFFQSVQVGLGNEADSYSIPISSKWQILLRGSALTYLEPGTRPLFRMRDAALAWRIQQPIGQLEVAIGRMHKPWSELDRFWGLGVFAPRFRVEPFSPSEDGLTGLHLGWASDHGLSLDLFASPVSLPDQGPPMGLESGVFLPLGPWAVAPQRQIQMGGGSPQIVNYSIQADLAELLVRPTFTGRFSFGKGDGLFGYGTLSYGAMHTLLMSAQVSQSLQVDQPTSVVLRPRLVQRWASEGSIGYRQGKAAVSMHVLHEAPVGTEILAADSNAAFLTGVVQDVSPSTVVGMVGRWNPSVLSGIELGWMSTYSPFANDVGALAPDQGTLFDPRWMFRSAVQIAGHVPLPWYSTLKLHLRQRVVADLGWRGLFSATDLMWAPNPALTVQIGLDLIGSNASENGAESAPNLSFDSFRRYRANDRIRGEISYVF